MADKTLRIIFSGISTLWPGPPRKDDKPPHQAFVIMPANVEKKNPKQTNEWGTTIPDHFPFVHVAASLLINPPWPPDETVVVGKGGEHFIYFFPDARVVIDPRPKPGTRIEYFIDPKGRPLSERPGSYGVAPPHPIRWLADARDILSEPVPLKINPAATSISNEAAAIVNLDGGALPANLPRDTLKPKTFVDAQGPTVAGLRRVLADE